MTNQMTTTFITEISENIDKTRMNKNNKDKSLKLASLIVNKITNNRIVGNSSYYCLDKIKNKIIKELKGYSGEWLREASLNYTSLEYLFVKSEMNGFKHLASWTRTIPSEDDDCYLTCMGQFPAIYIWDQHTSRYFEIVETTINNIIIDLDKYDKEIVYTVQKDDNLIKINTNNQSIYTILTTGKS